MAGVGWGGRARVWAAVIRIDSGWVGTVAGVCEGGRLFRRKRRASLESHGRPAVFTMVYGGLPVWFTGEDSRSQWKWRRFDF